MTGVQTCALPIFGIFVGTVKGTFIEFICEQDTDGGTPAEVEVEERMSGEFDLFKFSSEELIGIFSFPVRMFVDDSKSHPMTYPKVTASTPAHTTAAAATAASNEHGDI